MLSAMELRDRFAVHFAAALVDAFADAGDVARRAYDLAEAMLEERARRIDADEGHAIALEPRPASRIPAPVYHHALLDEPEPMIEADPGYDDDLDPSWLEPPYDPSWDLDPHWAEEPLPKNATAQTISTKPPGPGLARTRPEDEEAERKERSA
jgi:hypothetical protein